MATIKKLKNGIQSFLPAGWWGETWREGFFSGNGKTGINVFGGALNEKVLINSGNLNWQGKVSVVPDLGSKIKDVKKLVEEGKVEEAQAVLPKLLVSKNFRPQPYSALPLVLLNINMKTDKTPKDFNRVLNTSNGEITVSYLDGTTRISRDVFVSRTEDCVVLEISKTGQKLIETELSFDTMDKINARTSLGLSMMPDGVSTKYEHGFMYYSARNDDGTEYGAVAKVTFYGGSMSVKDNCLSVQGANNVLVVIKTFVASYKEKEFKALKTALLANKDTYDKMLKKHQNIHQKAMDGVSLEIEPSSSEEFVEDMLTDCKKNGVLSPKLAEKLWNLGRYLFYCSTAPDSKILLSSGLFNGSFKAEQNTPSFDGKTQCAYKGALAGDMTDAFEPLFVFAEQNIGDMRENAMRLFGVRGAFLPAVTAGETGRIGSVEPQVLHFTGCAGWLAGLFYDHWLFSKDTKFLKNRALPFLKEVAQFYEEFFKLTRDNIYESNPGYSPLSSEGTSPQKYFMGKNAAIDFSIARQLFSNIIEGATAAGMYKDEIPKWQEMLTKIPPLKTDADGVINDYADLHSRYETAGVGAMYSAFAGREVDFLSSEEVLKVYNATARKKLAESGNFQTALTLLNLAEVFVRLEQKSQALECLSNAVNFCSLNNLALAYSDWRANGVVGENVWSPIQLTANMTFSSVLQEMFLYSKEGIVKILPCLPAEWKNFQIKGLAAAGALTVNIELNAKSGLLSVEIKAKKNSMFDLYLPNNVKKLKKSNVAQSLDNDVFACIKGISIAANKTASFVFVYSF